MKDQLPELLDYIGSICKDSADFVLAQAPEVVQQLILLKRIEYTLALVVCAGITLYLAKAAARWHRKAGDFELFASERDFAKLCTASAAGGGSATALLTYYGLQQTLTVWLAPKVYILEYVTDLVK